MASDATFVVLGSKSHLVANANMITHLAVNMSFTRSFIETHACAL